MRASSSAIKVTVLVSHRLMIVRPPSALKQKIISDLTIRNPKYDAIMRHSPYGYTNVPETLCLAEEDHYRGERVLSIPRGYDIAKHYPAGRIEYLYSPVKTPDVVFPVPKLKPNAEQAKLLKALSDARAKKTRKGRTYLFESSTSTGKTIFQALAGASFGGRVLVLCKTNLIRKAWTDDLSKLYGLKSRDIGRIQQKVFKIGEHFTVSSLATLFRRKHIWADIFKHFRTVILDEAHILPAEQVYQFLNSCPCKHILGATGTLPRGFKRELVYATFGKPVLSLKADVKETASSMPVKDAKEIVTNFWHEISRDNFDYQKLIDAMVGSDSRNELIAQEVAQDCLHRNRICVVTTNRVAHAELLCEMIREAGVDDCALLTGAQSSQSEKTRKLITAINTRGIRCIVATDQVISTGANINALDMLHVTMPIKDSKKFEQLLGRIRRKHEGKVDAQVKIYSDRRVPYLYSVLKRVYIPVFASMKIKRWENTFLA